MSSLSRVSCASAPENFSVPEPPEGAMEEISKVIKTVATTNVAKLVLISGDLTSMQEKYNEVNPFTVWSHVYQDQALCREVIKIKEDRKKWIAFGMFPGFREKTVNDFIRFHQKNQLTRFFPDFKSRFPATSKFPSKLPSAADIKGWNEFVDELVECIAHRALDTSPGKV